MFNGKLELEKFKKIEPTVVENEKGRFYSFGEFGPYPSITTVLGATDDKSGLVEWQNRVGIEKAKEISDNATRIGNQLHLCFENWLVGNEYQPKDFKAKQMFNLLKPSIKKRMQSVYMIECPLFSKTLKVAGRTDLICVFDDVISVLDWKSNHGITHKNPEWIVDYKIQAAFYATAFSEMYGIEINHGVLGFGNIFSSKIDKFLISDYYKLLVDKVNQYYDGDVNYGTFF